MQRKVRVVVDLIQVRVLRIFLLVSGFFTSIKLGVPLKYSTFSLLPKIQWKRHEAGEYQEFCETSLNTSVDVVISLYRFEEFESVLSTSVQSCFGNKKITFHFVIVEGTDRELKFIKSLVKNSHHKIHVSESRIGIYAAWNKAILSSSGNLITNLNADDLRLPHSICKQAASLSRTNCDGNYGNFILTDNVLSYLNPKTEKSLVSSLNEFNIETLVFGSQNLMHCAPMWKRALHDKFGKFDDTLKSSGDTEFWLRAMEGGATFELYPAATVVYFHNPDGLSTSMSSAGHSEWRIVRDQYLRNRRYRVTN